VQAAHGRVTGAFTPLEEAAVAEALRWLPPGANPWPAICRRMLPYRRPAQAALLWAAREAAGAGGAPQGLGACLRRSFLHLPDALPGQEVQLMGNVNNGSGCFMSCHMPKLIALLCCSWEANYVKDSCALLLWSSAAGVRFCSQPRCPQTPAGGSSLTDVTPGLRQTMCTGRC